MSHGRRGGHERIVRGPQSAGPTKLHCSFAVSGYESGRPRPCGLATLHSDLAALLSNLVRLCLRLLEIAAQTMCCIPSVAGTLPAPSRQRRLSQRLLFSPFIRLLITAGPLANLARRRIPQHPPRPPHPPPCCPRPTQTWQLLISSLVWLSFSLILLLTQPLHSFRSRSNAASTTTSRPPEGPNTLTTFSLFVAPSASSLVQTLLLATK